MIESFINKPYYSEVMKNDNKEWGNWIWQQQNTVKDVRNVKDYFTEIDPRFFDGIPS